MLMDNARSLTAKQMFDLSGKKAMVTGAGKLTGLAKAMAEGLLEAGAEVCLLGRTKSVFDVRDFFLEKGYKCYAAVGDVTNRNDLEKSFNEALALLNGRVDILINAAGIQRRYSSEVFPLELWDEVVKVNIDATFIMCQLAGRKMIENGYGKIINIASMLSFTGGYHVPAYAATKHAVAGVTKALTNDWASKGVRVNAIAPGYIKTNMGAGNTEPFDESRIAEVNARIPIGFRGEPEDLKGLAVFLASPASDYISGAIIPCDGGFLVR